MFNRIFYETENGRVINQVFTETDSTDLNFDFMVLPPDYFNYNTHYIERIDDGKPVIKEYPKAPASVDIENEKLKEDVLLLQTENEVGGIL